MIHLKKHILTLALLIAATTGAWATDYLYLVIDDGGTTATLCYGEPEDYPYLDVDWKQNGTEWDGTPYNIRSKITTVTIDESCQNFNGESLNLLFYNFKGLTTIIRLDNLRTDNVEYMYSMFEYCSSLTKLDLSSFNTAKVINMSGMFMCCEKLSTLDLSSFNTAKVENMTAMFIDCYKLVTIYVSNGWSTDKVSESINMFYNCEVLPGYASATDYTAGMAKLTTDGGYLTYKAPGTPVALPATDDMNRSLSLTQPAGNVTVSVKYYQQAKFTHGGEPAAISDVQANTDNPIVTAGTVKNIPGTTTPSGTVMYYASTTALSDAELLALSADKWSSDVPKATNLGQGSAYVYYYILGAEPDNVADRTDANTCSDSDIKAANVVNVTLLAPPAYDVSLNKTGLATGEPDLWKAKSDSKSEVVLGTKDLEGVTPGETVTVTYTGSRKVIGVKAEKKPDTKYLKWDKDLKKWVKEEIPATATKVENYICDDSWPAGTYLVEGDVTIDGYIHLYGDVELIIKDGAKLTANRIDGFKGISNYSLSIYGQTKMSGELNIAPSDAEAICNMTALNIHSCKVNAISSNSRCGGFYNITEVNVYGGSVDAEYTGGSDGYGISPTTMNIYGGEVKAVGKGNDNSFSYGIRGSDGTAVNVYGGKLWAECTGNRAINSNVTLTKDNGYTSGKIETSDNGTSWSVYTETGTPDAKYVRVGY